MAVCPKCQIDNAEGRTRCRECEAILPVPLNSSTARWERTTRKAPTTLVCPKCAERNAYSRFRCQACGASLTQHQPTRNLAKWVVVAAILLLALGLMVFLRQG